MRFKNLISGLWLSNTVNTAFSKRLSAVYGLKSSGTRMRGTRKRLFSFASTTGQGKKIFVIKRKLGQIDLLARLLGRLLAHFLAHI